MAELKRVWIEDGECISCESCVEVCPDVFEMAEDTCVVKPEAEDPEFLKERSESIIEAADTCPVDAIKYE